MVDSDSLELQAGLPRPCSAASNCCSDDNRGACISSVGEPATDEERLLLLWWCGDRLECLRWMGEMASGAEWR